MLGLLDAWQHGNDLAVGARAMLCYGVRSIKLLRLARRPATCMAHHACKETQWLRAARATNFASGL